ncbi:hypothetical protein ZOD2009_21327 [Haladaptatus paucihalophilus DX253]|uniref:Uncharacterized protein n=1 Tax=Haladaptatus paucihalophilus DX253 TaxID=797209 RepID=E7QZQ6_HALPU|nr:hypothetical protein ZOD2009_21327 [Haladaptatus paucihalophilus DX253]
MFKSNLEIIRPTSVFETIVSFRVIGGRQGDEDGWKRCRTRTFTAETEESIRLADLQKHPA